MSEASRRTPWYLILLRPAVGLPLALVLLALSAPFAYRNFQLHRVPDIGEPFDIERYRSIELAPEENAFELYSSAVALVTPMSDTVWKQCEDASREGWTAAGPECRAWLEENREALGQFVLASGRRDALYIQPGEMTHLTLIPVISGLRPFVWLARLEVMRLEHAGDPAGAFRHLRAILQASRHCGRHGGLTERIVGMSFHRIAVDGLIHWAHLPIVQTEPLHAALAESRAAFETTALPSGPIRVDYLICRHTLEDPLARLTELSQNLADDLQMDWRWSYFEGEPELSRRLIRCVYANWLSQCDLPHSQRAPFVGTRLDLFDCPSNTTTGGARLSAETLSDLVWRSPYAGRVMFSIKYFLERHDSEQALQLLLETALQLQIYYRQHGDFPESLDKLAESFGEQAPIDQFGRGKPLRYRLSRDAADGATVWSVGPDETDDAAHQNLPDGRGDDKDIVIHVLPPATAH